MSLTGKSSIAFERRFGFEKSVFVGSSGVPKKWAIYVSMHYMATQDHNYTVGDCSGKKHGCRLSQGEYEKPRGNGNLTGARHSYRSCFPLHVLEHLTRQCILQPCA